MRAVTIAFYIMCFMFGMNLLHSINTCYMYGNAVTECPDEAGQGHPFIPFEIQPLFGYTFKDASNINVNASDSTSYTNTMKDIAEYKPGPPGLSDVFGFFSWVVTGGRFIINSLFMPLYGFPTFLQKFWIPEFATVGIGSILFFIEIVGIYEFFTGREVFKRQ